MSALAWLVLSLVLGVVALAGTVIVSGVLVLRRVRAAEAAEAEHTRALRALGNHPMGLRELQTRARFQSVYLQGEGLADLVIAVMDFCNVNGICLEAAVLERMAKDEAGQKSEAA